MIVRFFTSSYAPGMVQAQPVSGRRLAAIRADMRRNGAPDNVLAEGTALLSWEDAEATLSPKSFRELSEGWGVNVRMDDFDARNLYGHTAR